MDIQNVVDLVEKVGFPLFVAIWALWRLDKFLGKGESLQESLDEIEEQLDRVETVERKNSEILAEVANTLKTFIMMNRNSNGGDKDDR